MISTDIEKKYGKELAVKMIEYLEGCSTGKDEDGHDVFQEKDVLWAHREATGDIHPPEL